MHLGKENEIGIKAGKKDIYIYIYGGHCHKYTNVAAFSETRQAASVLKEHVGIPNKSHIISIQASIQNIPIPLQLEGAKPATTKTHRPGRLN